MSLLVLLLFAVAIGFALRRLWQGPSVADRLVAADTLSVIITALLAWVAWYFQNPLFLDVALVYAALAFIGTVALARVMEKPQTDAPQAAEEQS